MKVRVRDNAVDKISPRWDISQERAFVETLLNQRLNFFLVVFTLVCAGALNAQSQPRVQTAILLFGGVVCGALASTIARAQQKLDLILGILSEDAEHPHAVIDRMAGPRSKRKLVGYFIPALCTLALFGAGTLSVLVRLS